MASTNDTNAQIAGWYNDYLGRNADAEGLKFWTDAAASGRDLSSLKTDFLNAAVDNSVTGTESASTSSIIGNIYQNDLGKQADAQGLDWWINGAQDLNNDIAGGLLAYANQKPKPIKTTPTTISKSDLSYRTINPTTETVRGQMQGLLAEDSQYMQLARADAQRQAAERGLTNSAMAASAGTDAAIRNAVPIATSDAGFYGKASDYNTALDNEITKYNADTLNQFASNERGFNFQLQRDANQNAYDWQKTQSGYGQQITLQQMQNEIDRWKTQYQGGITTGNNDAQYKQQQLSMANNIILNTEWSPERKASMLESLGLGTSSKRDATGKVIPGTGLAGSVYVIDSVSADLAPNAAVAAAAAGNNGVGNNGGS